MEDWATLRKRRYEATVSWSAFLDWADAPTRTPQYRLRELQGEFLETVVPMLGSLIRRMQYADQEDICSWVSFRLLRRMEGRLDYFRRAGNPNRFTSLLLTVLRRMIIDWFRCNSRDQEIPREMLPSRRTVSVPQEVDLRMVLDDLPEQIVRFTLARDRLGFGRRPIQTVVRLLLAGKDCPPDMLKNWLNVRRPDRCIAFVTLNARWFLHRYRDRYSNLLTEEQTSIMDDADMFCHVL